MTISDANTKVERMAGFRHLHARLMCLAAAVLFILEACSLTPASIDQFEASAVQSGQKVVYGRIQKC